MKRIGYGRRTGVGHSENFTKWNFFIVQKKDTDRTDKIDGINKIDRIKQIREAVDKILDDIPEEEERKSAYIHLYGVAQAAAFLAQKRKENTELAVIAAMLHDIHTYKNGSSIDHAHKGAVIAKEILKESDLFSKEETDLIYSAIYHHSDKEIKQEPFEELLKDADVLQHVFYQPLLEIKANEQERFRQLMMEFGIAE